MPGLSRQQLIAWSAVGLVILLIGANYLRGQLSAPAAGGEAAAVTIGLKEDRTTAALKIHVVGAVASPGLYEVAAGSRVADALAKAGGPAPTADLNQINLAAKLADGQQLIVPEKGAGGNGAAGGAGAAGPGAAGAGPSGAQQPINLNSATIDQLNSLDGIGPKTAQKIIDYREAHGGFKSVEELLEVPGIGPSKFDQIKNQVVI
ncbi:MAG: helix-hairpin-helix domain-containing protein [Actinobacteria bacterium]|nr:helix-hairpin-helix domain-containing protein [Actinomycetota bacterium]MCL5882773.1 helix-hairpin-helix domain-containing protein [Actinomycetota bacterium]